MDLVEDLRELGLELVVVVEMSVAQLVYVFGEVAEEEDVFFTNFTSDFDLDFVS